MSMGVLDRLTEKSEAAYRAVALRVAREEAVDESEIRDALGMTGRGVVDLQRDVETIQRRQRILADLRKADELAGQKGIIEAKLDEARKTLEAVVAESRTKIAEAGQPVQTLRLQLDDLAKLETSIRTSAERELHREPVAPEAAAKLEQLRVEQEAANHKAKDCRDAITKAARWRREFDAACKSPSVREINDPQFGNRWPEWHPKHKSDAPSGIPFPSIMPFNPGRTDAEDSVAYAACKAAVERAEQEAKDGAQWFETQYMDTLADIVRRTIDVQAMIYGPSGVTWSVPTVA